jgi:hypothetical protein
MSGGTGIATYEKGSQDLGTHQKGTGWVANLYGGVQSGNDWAACYIPVDEVFVSDFNSALWTWYQTATETMGLGMVVWVHDPNNLDNRAEITQLANVVGLDKSAGWNSHEFDKTVTQMFFYGENTTGTDLTAGTQYTWAQFQTDPLFRNWTIYRVSFDWGWESSGTFESAYLAEVKLNGVSIPIRPDRTEISNLICSTWKSCVIADEGTVSAECDLGAPYKYVTVLNPTIDSAAVSLSGAMTAGGTYFPVYVIDSTGKASTAEITTAATTSKATIYHCGSFQYIKVNFGAAQNSGPYTLYLRGFN